MDPAEAIDVWQSLEMGETHRLETTFRRADGTTFPVEVQIRRVDVQGEDRFLATSRDISERKAYERRIERENERLDEFASIVSHDLRNPLNVLSGYLRLARETGNESYFERCDTALDEMERLIADVLTLARQGDAVGRSTPSPSANWRPGTRPTRSARSATTEVAMEPTPETTQTIRSRSPSRPRATCSRTPAGSNACSRISSGTRPNTAGTASSSATFRTGSTSPTTVPEYLKTGAMRCSKAVTRPPSREPGSARHRRAHRGGPRLGGDADGGRRRRRSLRVHRRRATVTPRRRRSR